MREYTILMHPGQNRVFFDQSKDMALAEFEIASARFNSLCSNIEISGIAGVDHLQFRMQNPLSDHDIDILSRLSSFYALFEKTESEGGVILRPIESSKFMKFNLNIAGMLKYSGKTNEAFTRMMINNAIFASDFGFDYDMQPSIKILDPLCGKGTALFDSAYCGYDTYGIEIAEKVVNEAAVFFRKFLESEKFKHSQLKQKMSGANKSYTANTYKYTFAKDKEAFKKPEETSELMLVAGNSKYADGYFGKNFAHVIVGDLPYGVAHRNVSGAGQTAKTRNPRELLRECVPAWSRTLKKGGVIALSWNVFLLPKEDIAHIMEQNGLAVFEGAPYDRFEHRVDQAIKRDIIMARKP